LRGDVESDATGSDDDAEESTSKRTKPAAAAPTTFNGGAVVGEYVMVDFENRPDAADVKQALSRVNEARDAALQAASVAAPGVAASAPSA
jgi:hypothetical protein